MVKVSFTVRGTLPREFSDESTVPVDESSLDHITKGASIFVLDLFGFSKQVLDGLRAFPVTVCIDDGSPCLFTCDALINPNVNREFTHLTSEHTLYLHGGQYVILRPQFDNIPARKCKEHPSDLLVAFGGTDPERLTLPVIRLLMRAKNLPFERITVIVVDPSQIGVLQHTIRNDKRFELRFRINNVSSVMQSADVGLVTAGTMMYECAVTGLPSIILSLDERQAREARTFAYKGAAHYLGDATQLDRDTFQEAVSAVAEKEKRQRMAKAVQSLIDGKGRERVADAIMDIVQRKRA
jgi:spore coat polysaccharide biosynthesis predicted glycosyltransferase SpsG